MARRAATRGSRLARWQTDHVAAGLERTAGETVESIVVTTTGDARPDATIRELGGKGSFVKEVQAAVLDGRADMAVHSAKDLPSETPAGLTIAAVLERADARDALVGSSLAALAPGDTVATGSARRRAQLAWHRPDLTFAELRGNIATRLEKGDAFAAIVMAAAALDRLGLSPPDTERLAPDVMVPQVGQGAIAVECRTDDPDTRALLETLDHLPTSIALTAERAFLAELGGDCDLPAGAHATVTDGGGLAMTAMLASLDGRVMLAERRRVDRAVDDGRAATLGRELARHLLDDAGGADLLVGAGFDDRRPR